MVNFETLVSRNVVRFVSDELDLSGYHTSVNSFIRLAIIGGLGLFILGVFIPALLFKVDPFVSAGIGFAAMILFEVTLYAVLEYRIDKRKSFVESVLPDYLQLTAANIRSGVALDKALIASARPEFSYFRDDILLMGKQLYSGETMQSALANLSNRYRSTQFKRTTRMMSEALRYGGGMADILNQIAKDLRNQQTIQKEIAGQLFMYTIFITFAAVVAAPVLFGLTNRMISITDTIWGSILSSQGTGGLGASSATSSLSFLKPHPPTVQPTQYQEFSLIAIVIITGMSGLIVSAISSGSVIKGIKYVPIFIIIGLVLFYVVGSIFGALLGSVATGV